MKNKSFGLSSFALHIIAMLFMLLDHIWLTLGGVGALNCIGRLAFPIFAFLAVEGYHHTHSFRKYILRLLALALISEIPFNLATGGSVFSPAHQNVIWTLLLGLLTLRLIDKSCELNKPLLRGFSAMLAVLFGYTAAMLCRVDYGGAGVLTLVLLFLFRGDSPACRTGQLLGLCLINFVLLGGHQYSVTLFGQSFGISRQNFAVLSFVFILLYNGRQGIHGKLTKAAFYLFYPVHLLILAIIAA